GEVDNSPMVWNRYAKKIQTIDALPKFSEEASLEANIMKIKPNPMMIVPIAILKRDEDSFPFSFLRAQKAATIAPNIIIYPALRDWKTAAGISHQSPRFRFTFSSVYRFIKPPACSKA